MSGSITTRQYTSDNGATYSIRCDESNANATASAGGITSPPLLPIRTTNQPFPPVGLKPRYVNAYNSANPAQRRRFKYSTSAQTVVLADGATISCEDYPAGGGNLPGVTQTWIVTSPVGEKSRKPKPFNAPDTGLTDNTVSQ